MASRARRRDSASADRLRALTRRAYLATAGHLEVDEGPAVLRPAARPDFDEILTGRPAGSAPPQEREEHDDRARPDAPAEPAAVREPVRWRVGARAAVAAILVLATLTGVVVARSLLAVGDEPIALPTATEMPAAPTTSGEPGPGPQPPTTGTGEAPTGADPGPDGPPLTDAGPSPPATVLVHVAGAVQEPGVVTVPGGARVADAVDRAGGPTAQAELGGVNLARAVVDGEQVFVPEVGEAAPGSQAGVPPTGAAGSDGHGGGSEAARVDLNAADQAGLETLPGVGPAIAQRILEWREQNGAFHSVEELQEVAGIGPATLERLRQLVTV